MKKWLPFLIMTFFLSSASSVGAASAQTGSIYIAPDQIISGNLYVAGESIVVEGTISGDLIAVAQKITVSGHINGDLIAIAPEILVTGEIGGNARVAGSNLTINGSVARNVNSFGSNLVFGPESRIGWDVYLAGENISLNGVIGGNLSGHAKKATISGQIGKNVNLTMSQKTSDGLLVVSSTGVINGDLKYSSLTPANISAGASIAGETLQTTPSTTKDNNWLIWVWKELFAVFSAFAVGLMLIYVGKNITRKILNNMEDSPAKMFLPGLTALLILPPLALLLALSIIGLPLSLIVAATWMILFYLGKILSAVLVGRLIINKLGKPTADNFFPSLIVGVLLIWLLAAIPYFGWLVSLSAALFGMGGLWNYVYRERQNI